MMPLVAEWKGMPPRDGDREPTPLLTLVGRRGQLISVDPYANTAGGPNMVICGQTGSGKSFLLNDLIASVLRTGGKVWVIDVGFSYRNLCEIYHGQYIDFDPKSGLCINPFELVNEPEDLDEVVKPIVAQMASLHRPLSDYELAQLQMHIKSLVADQGLGGVVPDITALAQSLISNCQLGGPNPLANDEAWRKKVAEMDNEERAKYCDPRIRDLGVQLLPFTADGNYGHFFNGPTNVEFKSNFIVLELEHLKKNKHLQAVVLMLLMQLIAHEVYLGDPSVKKLVLLDEAWDLLKVGGSAEFIEGMYRRIRKTGGACATATQSIQDYSSPAGQAALANADCMFLLRQKPESIEYLIESKKIVLDEYQLELLRSVTKTDDYSECYVRIGDHPGTVGRLIVDAYSKFIYSTKPTDRAAINAYRGQGFSLADAIQKVMADRGVQGVSALRMDTRAQYTEA
jgi:conjugal transfer ATP-binding protein TraC